MIQLQDRTGDPVGNHPVDDHQHHSCKQHQKNNKIPHIDHSVSKDRVWNHTYQLPSGIADCIDDHSPFLSIEFLFVDSFFISVSCTAVFAADPVADLYLAGMINDFPAAVAKVIILAVVGGIDLIHHP